MLECIGFAKQKVSYEGTESTRVVAKFNDLTELKVSIFKDSSVDEVITRIKADKALALKQIRVREGEFGKYAFFSAATEEEEL